MKKIFLTSVPQTGGPNRILYEVVDPTGQNYLTISNWRKIMKKLTLTAALVIALTSMTYAQKTVTSPAITVGANIIQGLVISGPSGPLLFGNSSNNIVKGAIDSTDTIINVHTDGRAVNLHVQGNGNEAITVNYPASVTLTSGLTYTPTAEYTATSTQGGTGFASGSSFSLTGSTYSTGNSYIWLGGRLAGASTVANGAYSTTFTISVNYTNE